MYLTQVIKEVSHLRSKTQYINTSIFQYFSISIFQYFSISVFQYFSTSVFQYFSISVFQYFSISVFQYFSISIFQYFNTSKFRYFNISICWSILQSFLSAFISFLIFRVKDQGKNGYKYLLCSQQSQVTCPQLPCFSILYLPSQSPVRLPYCPPFCPCLPYMLCDILSMFTIHVM